MIEVYSLISAFMFGVYIGAAFEREERPSPPDYFPLVVLSVLWPLVIGVLIWVAATRKE
jgi:hypothetical protein